MLRIAAEVGRALIATATVLMARMTSRRSRPRPCRIRPSTRAWPSPSLYMPVYDTAVDA